MKGTDLIHYRVDWSQLTHQQRLARLMAGFLAVMLILTLLSRGLDSMTVAQVSAETPKSGTIEHTVEAEGVLTANREVAVLALKNVLVESVEVHEGSAVKEGDLLFTLSMADLRRQLQEKQLERSKLALQLQELNLQKANAAKQEEQEKEKALQRAGEDYSMILEEQDDLVRRAIKDRENAADALDAFRDSDDYEDWKDSGDPDDDDLTIGASYSGTSHTQTREEFNRLKQALTDAREALRDAERTREKALLQAERAVEDAEEESPDSPTLQPQILSLSIQEADLTMEELQKAIDTEGRILAPADGVITSLKVGIGQRTMAEASAILAQSSEGYRMKVSLDSEQTKRVARGDKVRVTLSGKSRPVETVIESLSPSEEKPGGVDAVVLLPEGEVGQAASFEHTQRGESYAQCVPLSAVHGASGDQYVLVIDEMDSVLGRQQVARKVPVIVADSNETRAALSGGALQSTDKVIVSGSKNVFEGDRVRLEEAVS